MNSKNVILIDKEKCIGCGLCVADCVNGHLFIDDGKACVRDGSCIECGHCFAICPQSAVKLDGYDVSDCGDFVSMTEINPDTLLLAMKSRRTIRKFKPIPIEEDKTAKILEAGRYCPTGTNSQNVAFTVLGDKQDEIEKACVKLFKSGKKAVEPFAKSLKDIDLDEHYFFKGAPLVIVVSSKSNINAGLASAYMELMAESLGLGVLYSGFFQMSTVLSHKIRKMLQLPRGHKVVSCLVIGYPNVEYKRIAPRKDINLKILK